MQYLLEAAGFLIDVLLGLYILVLMLRFILQWTVIAPNHSLTQFINSLTQKPISFLNGFIPRWKGIELANILFMMGLQMLKIGVTAALKGIMVSGTILFILALADLLNLLIYIYIFALVIQAILSFVNPDPYHPLNYFLSGLTEPLLTPIKRRIKPINGIDLSLLTALLGLQLALILIVAPLRGIIG